MADIRRGAGWMEVVCFGPCRRVHLRRDQTHTHQMNHSVYRFTLLEILLKQKANECGLDGLLMDDLCLAWLVDIRSGFVYR